jgi:glutamate racemase
VLAFSTQSLDLLAEREVKAIVVACNTSTAVAIGRLRRRYDLPILGVIRPGASAAGAGHSQPAGRGDRDARHDPLARLLQRDQGREPGGRGLRARDADAGPAGRGRRAERTDRRGSRGRRLAPLLGERDAAGESIFPRPPGATIDTLLLGCTHYPLLRALIEAQVGEHVAIVDSATATASALAELLGINGLEADPDGAGAPPPADDRRRRHVPRPGRPSLRVGVPGRRTGRAGGPAR